MGKRSEKQVEQYLVNQFRKRGGVCWKWISPSRNGVPDRIGLLYPARVYFIEVKTKGGRVSKIQSIVWRILVKLGFTKRIVYSFADIDLLFEEIDNERH